MNNKAVEKYHKNKGLISLVILLSLCVYNLSLAFFSIIDSNTYAILNFRQYLAALAVVVSFIVFYTSRRYYKYVLLAILFLGTFDVINFMRYDSFLTIGSFSFGFHITPVLIGLVTIALYSERFRLNPKDSSGVPLQNIPVNLEARKDEEVKKFKLRFVDKSSESLLELISDKRYSVHAKQAAQEILDDRASLASS